MILRGVYLREPYFFKDGEMCGDIMTVKDYLECVSDGAFNDDDGFGHPMKDNKYDSQLYIYPSERERHIPLDATDIIWFNK